MIVDDHAMVRDGLSALIAQAPDMKLVGAAGDGRKALEEAAICQPDVIVMDLRLPEMDGVATTRVIHERTRKSKILMLSTFDREEDIYRSLQAGASGFLLKGASRQELLDGIRQVASGQTVLSQQAAEKLAEHVLLPAYAARARGAFRCRCRQEQQRDRDRPLYLRRHGKGAHQPDTGQAPGDAPHPGRHHRAEARVGGSGLTIRQAGPVTA
jgi:DNA-binding NarL/FixJ family response regulator